MLRKVMTGIALAGAVGLLLLFASPSYRQGEPSLAGSKAPDFEFQLDAKPAKLADLRGRVVVLNFWATWCPPCVEEMPSLERLHQQMGARGVVVLGVSVDEDQEAYERFLREWKITFPTYRDPSKKIAAAYETFMYPETYIIGADGRVARKIIGAQRWDGAEMTQYLRELLTH